MKLIITILLTMLLVGCSNKETINTNNENIKNDNEIINKEPKYIDENEVKLGLFLYDNNYLNKERIEDTYYTEFKTNTDIGSFEVFLTDDKIINGINFKNTWNTYYNKYENIEKHKIGFNIKFILSDGTNYNSNYFEPDTYKYSDYFYTFLYDDIHQEDGAFYSHLETIEENTLITSIKIHAGDKIEEVENIILTAFTYDTEDDFDEENNYRGNSLYVIRIKKINSQN